MKQLHYLVEEDNQEIAVEQRELLGIVQVDHGLEGVENVTQKFGGLCKHIRQLHISLEALKNKLDDGVETHQHDVLVAAGIFYSQVSLLQALKNETVFTRLQLLKLTRLD